MGLREAHELLVELQQDLQQGPEQVNAGTVARRYRQIARAIPRGEGKSMKHALSMHADRAASTSGQLHAVKVWSQVNAWIWRTRAWRGRAS